MSYSHPYSVGYSWIRLFIAWKFDGKREKNTREDRWMMNILLVKRFIILSNDQSCDRWGCGFRVEGPSLWWYKSESATVVVFCCLSWSLHGSQQVRDHKEACRLIRCDFKWSYVPAFPFFSHSLLQVTLLHTIQLSQNPNSFNSPPLTVLHSHSSQSLPPQQSWRS